MDKQDIKEFKHELVNSLSALQSVHIALQTRKNIQDADDLLVNVIRKLDHLKHEISKEEEEIND